MYIHVLELRIPNLNGGEKRFLLLEYYLNFCSFCSLSGDHGNQWRMGTVNVNIPAEFYFIFEGNQSLK
jgi:hypothetical protein